MPLWAHKGYNIAIESGKERIVMDTTWQPSIDPGARSKYKVLAEAIREGIVSGQLAPGSRLPPVRELAYRVGVTPGTVARAYTLMTEEGRLTAGVGRGTFVAERAPRRSAQDVPLINKVDETIADFRSSRVPDVGQGRIIDDVLMQVAGSHRRRHINYPTHETDLEVREALVGWLSGVRLGAFDASHIVLANGAQNAGLMCLMATLSGPNPVILCEDLAYPGVRHAARLLRAKVVGVPMDAQGVIPEALAHTYRQHGGQVLVTSPSIHSPTTISTPLERKLAIADVVRKMNLTVIEDECYAPFASDVPSYREILPDQTFYVSSLTKTVSGALRFGFAVAPQGQGDMLRQVAQSAFYGVAQPISDVCSLLLTQGSAAQIRADVFAAVSARVRSAVNVLGKWDIAWREDAPFIWLTMPERWRAARFMVACEAQDILVKPADEFALPDGRAPNAVRLAVGTVNSENVLRDALLRVDHILSHPQSRIEG